MKIDLKSAIATLLCAGMLAAAVPTESMAGPTGVAPRLSASLSSSIQDVRYRPHRVYRIHRVRRHRALYRRYRYGYNPGAAIIGSILGIMGSGAYYEYNYPYYYGYPGYYDYPGYYGYPYGYGYPVYRGGGGYRGGFGGGGFGRGGGPRGGFGGHHR